MGTIEVLPDGFGFLPQPGSQLPRGAGRHLHLAEPGPEVRPSHRRHGRGEIRGPKDGERYFALTRLASVNYDEPDAVRHRVNFDNLTPLYPDEKLTLDSADPTVKDKSAG
jgi:transcription termination factor Rho